MEIEKLKLERKFFCNRQIKHTLTPKESVKFNKYCLKAFWASILTVRKIFSAYGLAKMRAVNFG